MFTAKNEKGKVISLYNIKQATLLHLKTGRYFCPYCQSEVYLKVGQVNAAHFAHKHIQKKCTSSMGETADHSGIKQVLATWLAESNATFQTECYLQKLKQRPDILRGSHALEIQCSPIPLKDFKHRTKNYQRYGYYPLWLCSSNLINLEKSSNFIKQFCYFSEQLGFYFWVINLRNSSINLNYHLEEDYSGNLLYLTKTWQFFAEDLMEIFFYPKQKQLFGFREYRMKEMINAQSESIRRKLFYCNQKMVRIQGQFYKDHLHLLDLHPWFYFSATYQFTLKQSSLLLQLPVWRKLEILNQRIASKKRIQKILLECILQNQSLLASFPLTSQEQINTFLTMKLFQSLRYFQVILPMQSDNYFVNLLMKSNSLFTNKFTSSPFSGKYDKITV